MFKSFSPVSKFERITTRAKFMACAPVNCPALRQTLAAVIKKSERELLRAAEEKWREHTRHIAEISDLGFRDYLAKTQQAYRDAPTAENLREFRLAQGLTRDDYNERQKAARDLAKQERAKVAKSVAPVIRQIAERAGKAVAAEVAAITAKEQALAQLVGIAYEPGPAVAALENLAERFLLKAAENWISTGTNPAGHLEGLEKL